MSKFVVYENEYYELGQIDIVTQNSILKMSQQIKDSLGLQYQPIQLESHIESDNNKTYRLFLNRIIGNVSCGDIQLVVLPKVLSQTNKTDDLAAKEYVKHFMIRTLHCARDRMNSTIFFTKNNLVNDQGLFLEVLSRYYLETLSKAIRLISVATYQTNESKVVSVRGRVLVQKQLSEPMTDAKIWCRFKRISNNNAINALLIWACRFLAESVEDLILRKKLLLLVREFGNVNIDLTYQVVSSLRLPRQFSAYRESFSIAKNLYLGKIGRKETAGSNQVCGYVISTERAFERIVETYCGTAARKLGYAHRAQAMECLAQSSVKSDNGYSTQPDNLVFSREKKLIIDAKYKLLNQNNKPLREDFYQMVSSCIAHKVSEAVLLYPNTAGILEKYWTVIQPVNGKHLVIRSAYIDVFDKNNDISLEMINIIKNTDFHGDNYE